MMAGKLSQRRFALLLTTAASVAALVGTSIAVGASIAAPQEATTGMHASRHVLYRSLPEMAADADLIVVGTVNGIVSTTKPEAPTDPIPETIFDFGVQDPAVVLSGPPVRSTGVSVSAGKVVQIKQVGTPDMVETPAPLLRAGESYLLFLNVDESTENAYFIVGGSAGIYAGDGSSARGTVPSFVSRGVDGDRLPDVLTPSGA